LHGQIGKQLVILVALAMSGILFQLYLRHKRILAFLTWPVILVALCLSLIIGLAATVPHRIAKESGIWTPFDEQTIHRHVREGKIVFVDITADWCITCKANKRFTLAREEISEKLFNNDKVVAMQGDWTNPDPVITSYLQKFERYGIPFNIVYGPKAPDGIILPELLTPSFVLNAIEQAKGASRSCPANLPAGQQC
jgi:suppressor for copper-sensitivity B